MTDETATEAFSLDSALASAVDKVMDTKVAASDGDVKMEAANTEDDNDSETDSNEINQDTADGAEAPAADEKAATGGSGDEQEADTPIEPPTSWTAEAKERFSALPPELQRYISQRESEREKLIGQKSTELSEQQRKYEALEQILAPRRQALATAYGSEARALDQLFQLSDFATRDPEGFVRWFAQQRGINLQSNQAANDEYVDPVTQQIRQELQGIKQKLTQQEQNEINARQDKVRNEIASFRDEKDDAGNQLHPYFDEVKAEMASLLQSGAAKTLKHAYEMAQWANSGVRKKIQEAEAKAAEQKRIEAAKQAAAKAEKAKGVTVKSKKTGEGSKAKSSDWESTLNDLVDEKYASA